MIFENSLNQIKPFLRFLMVGIINTITGLSIMFILMNIFQQSYWVSTFIGNSSGALLSYILNRSFTFESTVPVRKGVPRFLLIILACYFLAFGTADILAGWTIMQSTLGTVISSEKELAVLIGTALYTVTNFLGQKYFVFSR
ncbi:polysaccharide biosynthesis protein GtrA [Bacillus sp. V3-13]|uniref:GtrA family protein n=1 Tax=Bacillus sp. V3-13 TaxID=2053728 RepID=UPI000C78B3AF|nr:GtrA family protein [Bacillus sp. V3-13]PLR76211.1 polysaccharide biosynthesis protein GtrA [Bacillus sp. V3-13]